MAARLRPLRAALTGIALALAACASQPRPVGEVPGLPGHQVQTPADLFGPLYRDVELRRLFADGKTFADAVPRRAPAAILADYRRRTAAGALDDAGLRRFVLANFTLPKETATPAPSLHRAGPALPLAAHIAALWPHLTRNGVRPAPGSSALAVPERFVVPGGRFRELYYWDSYFTMLGLRADGRQDLIDAMIDDFVSLVDRYGHVPNGTRTYYVSRSQPPFLYLMMGLSDTQDVATLRRRLHALQREHDFWMAGADRLDAAHPAIERVVRMPDGAVLNRYYDDRDTPRDESYREDVETARASGRPVATVYRDLRAGAESGWDYSSRWLADGRTLATVHTTDIVPVDLNSLLYGMERTIAARCRMLGDDACGRRFDTMAVARAVAVERWLWNPAGWYGDRDIATGRPTPVLSAATAYPLFTGLASAARADAVAQVIAARLLAPGGLRTTETRTGQQWDAPNGWAPLQWIAAEGLRRAGHDDLAQAIADRFLATVTREYRASGKLVEKYDVEEQRPGGGGEYPTQDGFGWTNGVVRAFQERYPPR